MCRRHPERLLIDVHFRFPKGPSTNTMRIFDLLYLAEEDCTPRPPNVPPLRALWSAIDGIWGSLKGSLGLLVIVI